MKEKIGNKVRRKDMSLEEEALKLHAENKGKIEVNSKVDIEEQKDLSLAYTPGVAKPCAEIADDKQKVYEYTAKENLIAVVTDGTAVLGLGDIGPEASLPVMEGKSILFKKFGGLDAFPLCLDTTDPDEIVETVTRLAPTFGGINLEDISAPRCIEVEQKLKEQVDIPVFHDDQHGTAIVVLAGLINAARLVEKEIKELSVVINGAGAAGMAIARLLLEFGLEDIILVDKFGILAPGIEEMNWAQAELAAQTNQAKLTGGLAEAVKGRDVFIGVSAPNLLSQEMVQSMAEDPIVFALANPVPEIDPDQAKEAGAKVVATGRSDHPNQVNNLLAFPGILKGAMGVDATAITDQMKLAASFALADLIDAEERAADYIIPDPFDERVVNEVAFAVAKEAITAGLIRREITIEAVKEKWAE